MESCAPIKNSRVSRYAVFAIYRLFLSVGMTTSAHYNMISGMDMAQTLGIVLYLYFEFHTNEDRLNRYCC